MLIDSRGNLCTGVALAPNLVLTAAHCVVTPSSHRIRVFQDGSMMDVAGIRRHPAFNMANYASSKATADVALIKLNSTLPDVVVPAQLAAPRRIEAGDTLMIAGFGVTRAQTSNGLGQPRMAKLTVTGKPGSLQVRLFDPITRNEKPGLGACTGDSGGPAFDGDSASVIGIISWTTAARDGEGCGGLTGLTPLLNYRSWILETAIALGAPLR
jgi:secreted trypsin-like serine protease